MKYLMLMYASILSYPQLLLSRNVDRYAENFSLTASVAPRPIGLRHRTPIECTEATTGNTLRPETAH